MENENTSSQSISSKFSIPAAVIIAGLIIAGAVIYTKKSPSPPASNNPPSDSQVAQVPNPSSPLDNLNPITEKDHMLGNPNAPVTIVTFSDLECFYCKRFHAETMKKIMDEYGKDGRVRWVFRSFPLDIHPKAKNEAEAAECANELGGNEKFWAFIDRVFEVTPSNNGLDPKELPKIAAYIGLNKTKFEQCLVSASEKYDSLIKESSENAVKSGALGTPYSIIIGPKGVKTAVAGAYPFEEVKKEIDAMLASQ